MDLRIYYEDTDAAGVVYHANYLKFFERARTEYFRARELFVAELAAAGFVFPVVKMEIEFLAPGRHDDLLEVATEPSRVGGSSFAMKQQVIRKHDKRVLVSAEVTLACIGPDLKARRIPANVRHCLETGLSSVIP
jgi:acyl-CoA thioester hydrolase